MSRKIYIFLFTLILSSSVVNAQEKGAAGDEFDQLFTIGWDVNTPTGNKYVDEISWAGGKIEFRKMVKNNVSIGFDLSWNSYFEYKNYQTYQYNSNTDITTDLYKYNYTLPLAITVDKYFSTNGIFIPYVGLGLGATYARPSLIFNIYEYYDDCWGFLMRPELGAIIKFGATSDVGLLVSTRYSYSTNQSQAFKIDGLEAFGFNVGIAWLY